MIEKLTDLAIESEYRDKKIIKYRATNEYNEEDIDVLAFGINPMCKICNSVTIVYNVSPKNKEW